MAHESPVWPTDKAELYSLLSRQLKSLCETTALPLPALSNCAALLWEALDTINWAGFYLLHDETLVLGPFQGKVACTLIPVGRGVCGTAAATREIQLVPDVHLFPGHIACNSASNSEIVIPMIVDGQLLGVLDIDSPVKERFDAADAAGLQQLADTLLSCTDWRNGLL